MAHDAKLSRQKTDGHSRQQVPSIQAIMAEAVRRRDELNVFISVMQDFIRSNKREDQKETLKSN